MDETYGKTRPLQSEASARGQAESAFGQSQQSGESANSGDLEILRQYFDRGVARENWDWGAVGPALSRILEQHQSAIGGIVAQLIQSSEDRLGKAEECIDWYKAEVAAIELELAQLRSLLYQLESSPNQEDFE